MKSTLLFALSLGALAPAVAAPPSSLAHSRDWQRLLIYEADGVSPGKWRSAIHSPDFFLSGQGATDPEAELRATLAALLLPPSDAHDDHAKCRFPARRLWLQQQLPDQAEKLAAIACPAFDAWARPRHTDSVSLVFANGYLGNPASYYGHTFLKFNQGKSAQSTSLLDQTLNFGALAANGDDPVSYIVKGLTGGYAGGFSPIEFYFHNANYSETELRDMWEYRLDLPKEALQLVVAHAWEVTQKQYTYYFLRKNCAHRVAELLEMTDGVELIPRNRPWVMPQALMQRLARSQYAGKPLVAEVIYHPSRQSQLYRRYVALPGADQEVLSGLVGKSIDLDGPHLRALPMERRQAVIDTLLEYYQFTRERGKGSAGNTMGEEYVAALKQRFSMPPGDVEVPPAKAVAPGQGRAPSYVQLGRTHSTARGQSLELRIRPAYYDALDSSGNQPSNSALSMFDTYIRFEGGHWRLRRLDFLAIDSMNTAVTGLPGDKADGWRFRVGLDEAGLACQDCRVLRAQGDIGAGRELRGSGLFATVYAGGALQTGSDGGNLGFARIGASLLFRPGARFSLRVDHELRWNIKGRPPASRFTALQSRVALGRDYDLRLQLEHEAARRLVFGLGYYF